MVRDADVLHLLNEQELKLLDGVDLALMCGSYQMGLPERNSTSCRPVAISVNLSCDRW